MKNLKGLIIGGVAMTGLAAGVYSFTSDTNPDAPSMKNYEVIRMVDGQMTTYDTTLSANSTFSPNDYLAQLGFDNDEQISIIDFSNMGENSFTFSNDHPHGNHEGEMVFIEIDDEDIQTTSNGEGQEIRIEKKIMKTSEDGEEDINVNVDVQGLLEDINIDSVIAAAMEGHEGDSNQVFIKKMVISEEKMDGGDGNMEWESIDATDADFHHEVNGHNHHMEVAVWGESEDFTMVIVSDPANSPSQKGMVVNDEDKEVPMFKLYPNPATTTSQLDLTFAEKAPTSINITDMRGRTVAKMDLGDFKGQFNHTIDVAKWQKGVYVLQVDHGNEKIMEKLIVE
jgi:Secretion system C-terminal sorting domain